MVVRWLLVWNARLKPLMSTAADLKILLQTAAALTFLHLPGVPNTVLTASSFLLETVPLSVTKSLQISKLMPIIQNGQLMNTACCCSVTFLLALNAFTAVAKRTKVLNSNCLHMRLSAIFLLDIQMKSVSVKELQLFFLSLLQLV